jgi:hypothetical protein
MGHRLFLLLALLLLPCSLHAGQRATLFLDGGLMERDIRASAGVAELPLPPSVVSGSLRVVPLQGANLLDVQQLEVRPSRLQQRELTVLDERRKQIEDRLRALAVKEEIYKGAAKSQSAKAPRKTKANPEPVSAIRQGTDYAIAQLESVLRQQRRATEELTAVTRDLERRRREANVGGTLLRIRTDRRDAALQVRYLQRDILWRPAAVLRVNGTTGELLLTGGLPPLPVGTRVQVAAAMTDEAAAVPQAVDGSPRLAFPLTSLQEEMLHGLLPAFRYRFSSDLLPSRLPEEVSCYRGGEYLGTGPVKKSPESLELELVCGR